MIRRAGVNEAGMDKGDFLIDMNPRNRIVQGLVRHTSKRKTMLLAVIVHTGILSMIETDLNKYDL